MFPVSFLISKKIIEKISTLLDTTNDDKSSDDSK